MQPLEVYEYNRTYHNDAKLTDEAIVPRHSLPFFCRLNRIGNIHSIVGRKLSGRYKWGQLPQPWFAQPATFVCSNHLASLRALSPSGSRTLTVNEQPAYALSSSFRSRFLDNGILSCLVLVSLAQAYGGARSDGLALWRVGDVSEVESLIDKRSAAQVSSLTHDPPSYNSSLTLFVLR